MSASQTAAHEPVVHLVGNGQPGGIGGLGGVAQRLDVQARRFPGRHGALDVAGLRGAGGLHGHHAIGLAQAVEQFACRSNDVLAFFIVAPQGSERHAGQLVGQHLRMDQPRTGPLHGGDQFGGADLPVTVAVDEGQGAAVKFNALHGAGQGDPQFLVQCVDGEQFGRGVQAHLVKAAGPEETPVLQRCVHAQ